MSETGPQVQHVEVSEDEAGMRLDRWLRTQFPSVPLGALSKVVRTGQVRVDGGRAKMDTRLAAGQTAATHDGTEPARVAGTLVEKTATLRDALSASAEVDDALVRARRAAVAARLPARP